MEINVDRKRVLVAEDHPGLARALAFKLGQAGFEVAVYHDGDEAWRALQETHFDAIVTDYKMPGLSGAQLCRKAQELDTYADVPVIMVTAHDAEFDICRSHPDLKLAAIYPKPYSPRELVKALSELVGVAPAASPGR